MIVIKGVVSDFHRVGTMDRFSEHLIRRSVFLMILGALLEPVTCIEENQPEIFLSPRNFNPHPHQAAYDPAANFRPLSTGPVVFPPSPPDEDNAVNSNIVTVGRGRSHNHPIDNHPYAEVAQKHRRKFAGRFNSEDDRINPRVYEALTNHAAKVLTRPPSRLGKDYTLSSLSEQRKNYAFSYKVLDHLTGDDFSHVQSQNAQATNGEYRVKLPDGRLQIVSYVADKDGYKADVKYTDEGHHELVKASGQVRSQPVPKTNTYDYYYDDLSGSQQAERNDDTVIYAPLPTERSKIPQDYGYVTATPSPVLYSVQNVGPKVDIYTNNPNYFSSTVSPYLYEGAKSYQGAVVLSSTARPDLNDYDGVYVGSTPKYNLVVNQQENDVIYGKK